MELFMKGQKAIVTGASQGIGRAITKALALEGVQVLAVARNQELLDHLKADIKAAGGEPPITLVSELTDTGSAALIATTALTEMGQVDILVNNAGRSQPLDAVGPDEKWQESFTLEFERPRQLTQALLPHFMERKQGVVLNVISTFELKSINASAVAKTALTAWSKQLSAQVGPFNVRVNCLQPGLIDTENTRRIFTPQQRKEFAGANIALGDFGEVEDMANAAVFLVSPRARYVTGAVWNVDGGLRHYPF